MGFVVANLCYLYVFSCGTVVPSEPLHVFSSGTVVAVFVGSCICLDVHFVCLLFLCVCLFLSVEAWFVDIGEGCRFGGGVNVFVH